MSHILVLRKQYSKDPNEPMLTEEKVRITVRERSGKFSIKYI
jgi:hypothetical protein